MTTTLTATPTSTDVRLLVSTDAPGAHGIEVWRTMAGRETMVRAWPLLDGGAWAHMDIDVLFNVPLTYEAVILDEAGNVLDTRTEGPVTVTNGSAYLRDALVPESKLAVRLVGMAAGDSSTEVRRELLRPVGRQSPVAITDVRSSATGDTALLTMTDAESRQLDLMLNKGAVMLFTGPADFDIRWPLYLSFGEVSTERVSAAQSPARLWGLGWTEVDPPPVVEPTPAQTWQQLLDAGKKWQTLRGTSWLEVLYPPVPARTVRWG